MLIEIAFFQKLSPFIAQPQTALTALLFSLLLGGGVGSVLTSLLSRGQRPAAAVLLLICVAGLVAILVFVFPQAFEIGIDPRLAAMLVVLPPVILMGCPFPLALHGLNRDGLQSHTALLWGVNGVASVLGSALAMIIGLSWVFSGALFLGAVIYLGVAALFAVFALSARGSLEIPRP